MAQTILNVRVRPARVTALVSNTASQEDLLLAVKFLSQLWGGRYCQLLAVETSGDDRLATFRLSQSRPDFVYGIGIDHGQWARAVHEACQSRGYGQLEAKYVENLHDSVEEHITAAHVIHHLRNATTGAGQRDRPLRLIGCDPKSPLMPFIATMFGLHYDNLGSAIPNEGESLTQVASVADFVALHTRIVKDFATVWLDLASYGLHTRMSRLSGFLPPTIVVVDSLPLDLSLFWNLRMEADSDMPVWAIPIPVNSTGDAAVSQALKEWLGAFWDYRLWPNFCRVTSTSAPPDVVNAFAERLSAEFHGTAIKYVDPWEPTNRLPDVTAYDSERQLLVELSRRLLKLSPPRPKILEGIGRGSCLVELVRDVRRRRAVNELQLPPRPSTMAILNAPTPSSISLTRIPPIGDGLEGINIRCSGREKFVSVYLPIGDEILEEVLRVAGIQTQRDEKLACYRPVMKMLGGLEKAARVVTGQQGAILRELLAGPLSFADILGKAKLGKGKLPELAPPEFPKEALSHLDPVAKRVFWRRRQKLLAKTGPSLTGVESLLEFWADRRIVSRQWQLGPCHACLRSFWEPRVNISKPVLCPGCGTRLRLPPKLTMGYSLHRAIAHALGEGIVPVLLTGRFLRRLTRDGFFWIPGVKFQWDQKAGDLDLIACCDGYIVVGECKTLDETPPDTGFWQMILNQFATTIEVGKAVKATAAVLAVMADSFPAGFQEKVDQLTGPSMRSLLLNKADLKRGYRDVSVPGESLTNRLSMGDLVVDPMPERPRSTKSEPREVRTPLFTATYV